MSIDDMTLDFEIKALREEIKKLKDDKKRLEKVIKENDLEDELENGISMTPEEEICITGIEQILDLVKGNVYTPKDIQNYDILHKNLRLIRGKSTGDKKTKKTDVGELLRIVNAKEDK